MSIISDATSLSSLLVLQSLFPAAVLQLSALRVHDEGLKVLVKLGHQRVHKVLHSGLSLQHA